MSAALPAQAHAVVVGSGICGSSIAYHLAREGWSDVAMLEQGALIHGTTSHAPGLVGQLRGNPNLVRLLQRSVALYRTLRVDDAPGYFEVGSLRLASSPARRAEIERQCAAARQMGLPAELLTATEAQALFPMMSRRGVEAALLVATDGSAHAPTLATALRRGAQERGVGVFERVRVTGVEVVDGRVRAVVTDSGTIRTETLVVAAGIWSPRIGALAGVAVPLLPMQHQAIWTEPVDGLVGDSPMANLRDPDNLVYFRQDGASLVMGGYELDPAPFAVDAIPDSSDPTRRPFDPERFAPLMAGAQVRVPELARQPIARQLNGLESFTPDGEFLLGQAPEVAGLWLACGFCAHGVASSGGVGEAMARWIVTGDPGVDLSAMDIRRFGGAPPVGDELRERVCRIYRDYYSRIAA